jgi:diguanylate cyclase (GGDEF)-like protein
MMNSDLSKNAVAQALLDANALITMSFRDPVTQLYNAQGFLRAAEQLRVSDQDLPSAMWLLVELAHLKFIKHALGSEAGDLLLTRTADILRHVFRGNSVIGRLGTNQFAVLIPANPSDCNALIKELDHSIAVANSPEGAMALLLRGKFGVLNMRFSGSLRKWFAARGCMHISAAGVVSD